MDVSIITVNYRTRGLIKQGLKSIRRVAPKLNYEIFVVDNASNDGTAAMVRESFPEVKFFGLKENIGFGRANNLAMHEAKGKYIFIFNSDAMLVPGTLETLVAYMEKNPKVAIVAPKLVHPDRTRQDSIHRFPSPWIPVYRRTLLGRLPHAKKALDRYLMRDEVRDESAETEVDWAEGAALLVRREAIDKVGMFDERYFMYFEDTDWARRFWTAGWKVVYNPQASVIHYHRRESADRSGLLALLNRATRLHIVSAIKYFLKWRGQPNPR